VCERLAEVKPEAKTTTITQEGRRAEGRTFGEDKIVEDMIVPLLGSMRSHSTLFEKIGFNGSSGNLSNALSDGDDVIWILNKRMKEHANVFPKARAVRISHGYE
jgi:hypothetical protein